MDTTLGRTSQKVMLERNNYSERENQSDVPQGAFSYKERGGL